MRWNALLRRLIGLSLAMALLSTSFAYHHHSDDLSGSWQAESGRGSGEFHEVSCPQPTASHLHADRVVKYDTCLACFRHLLSGVTVQLQFGRPAPGTAALAGRPLDSIERLFRAGALGRAPPVSHSLES